MINCHHPNSKIQKLDDGVCSHIAKHEFIIIFWIYVKLIIVQGITINPSHEYFHINSIYIARTSQLLSLLAKITTNIFT